MKRGSLLCGPAIVALAASAGFLGAQEPGSCATLMHEAWLDGFGGCSHIAVLVSEGEHDDAFRAAAELLSTSLPEGGPPARADSAGTRAAALDYIEGWFTGDATRMARAVHPELAKRIGRASGGSRGRPVDSSADELIRQTAEGHGRSLPRDSIRTDVEILDITGNAASARIDAGLWIDYLHLARTDVGWRIVNVLWELR